MKWKPMNFSGRSVRLASRVIEMDEVFEVRIVVGFRCGTRSSKIACFTVSRSVAASMIRSHWPRSVSFTVVLIRSSAARLSAGRTFPRETWRSMLRSIVDRALDRLSSEMSVRSTS
jgi:hypothetical protein